jgi:hypothetical protein
MIHPLRRLSNVGSGIRAEDIPTATEYGRPMAAVRERRFPGISLEFRVVGRAALAVGASQYQPGGHATSAIFGSRTALRIPV